MGRFLLLSCNFLQHLDIFLPEIWENLIKKYLMRLISFLFKLVCSGLHITDSRTPKNWVEKWTFEESETYNKLSCTFNNLQTRWCILTLDSWWAGSSELDFNYEHWIRKTNFYNARLQSPSNRNESWKENDSESQLMWDWPINLNEVQVNTMTVGNERLWKASKFADDWLEMVLYLSLQLCLM